MFVVHPGLVISRGDGDTHYVGVKQLARLYNLPVDGWRGCTCFRLRGVGHADVEGKVNLYPRSDGLYWDAVLAAGAALMEGSPPRSAVLDLGSPAVEAVGPGPSPRPSATLGP